MFLQLVMPSPDAYSTRAVARALSASLSKRLLAPHGLKASTAFRSAQTLETLVSALVDDNEVDDELRAALDNLAEVLTLRVSQSIAGADDEEIYQLGKVLAVTRTLGTLCRRNTVRPAIVRPDATVS